MTNGPVHLDAELLGALGQTQCALNQVNAALSQVNEETRHLKEENRALKEENHTLLQRISSLETSNRQELVDMKIAHERDWRHFQSEIERLRCENEELRQENAALISEGSHQSTRS